MFCLDYFLSFAAHLGITYVINLGDKKEERKYVLHPIQAFATGSLAGLTSALILYPFDFVRMATVSEKASHFAWSSVPFSTCYLGIYFSFRDHESLQSQSLWALISMVAATAAEVPFDKAKQNMVAGGSARMLAVTAVHKGLGKKTKGSPHRQLTNV